MRVLLLCIEESLLGGLEVKSSSLRDDERSRRTGAGKRLFGMLGSSR